MKLRETLFLPGLVLLVLAALSFVGGCNKAAQEADTQGSQAAGEGFALYLLAGDVKPSDLPRLSHLQLAPAPILTADQIVSYSRDTHEIEVTSSAYQAIAALRVPVEGLAFAACVDGSPVYAGAFWTPISSLSYDGVIIQQMMGVRETAGRYLVRIDLGYPDPNWYKGEDPRSDPRIAEALSRAGKLR
jgi:hypothetical protein